MANKVLRAAALKRNIEMTEHAIAKIGEFRDKEFGSAPVPEVVERFLSGFRRDMDTKLAIYRQELENIERDPGTQN
jgi:hypothetical protein